MILNKNFKRYFACFMAANLLFQVVTPTAAWALTGGPSQPEMESFEPVSTTEMVDLFTGDFVYNIPLLTVPGPNGGYPINIAYHAGIGMEQEASWVGLGWNISPGVINRQMRGIPDDFNGTEKIKKTLSYKPNWTVSLGFDARGQNYTEEIFGTKTKGMFGSSVYNNLNSNSNFSSSIPYNYQLYFNNYKGVGFSFGSDFSKRSMTRSSELNKLTIRPSLNYSFDSQNGFGIQPNLGFDYAVGKHNHTYHVGGNINAGFNSFQGLTNMGFAANYRRAQSISDDTRRGFKLPSACGIGYSMSAYLPPLSTSLTGINSKVSFSNNLLTASISTNTYISPLDNKTYFIKSATGNFNARTYSIGFSNKFIPEQNLAMYYSAYGYLNMDKTTYHSSDLKMTDYNREKDLPLTKDVPTLPLPINTYDLYTVKGQGTGGFFRAMKDDIGIFSEPSLTNDFVTVQPGVEFAHQSATDVNNHFGGDINLGYSQSYSGPWKNFDDDVDALHFNQGKPAYFRMAGEMTANADYLGGLERYQNEDVTKFGMNMKWYGISFLPKVSNYSNGATILSSARRNSSEQRVSGIFYRTRDEVVKNSNLTNSTMYIWTTANTAPWSDPENSANSADWDPIDFSTSSDRPGNQIAEMSVINPDGNRYNYGIPVYNSVHNDYFFACDNYAVNGLTNAYKAEKLTEYDLPGSTHPDVDVKNKDGYDHYYSKTEFPDYAHSYLLTSIVSPDYVDVDGNGPSAKDLGYYVKFNYFPRIQNVKWRAPYKKAFLHKNGISDFHDDKASFSYGEKELWYNHSIETKTHVAVFELGYRQDGIPAIDEHLNSGTPTDNTKSQYLKTIKLYAKSDLTTPIKTVNFEYDYSLCPGVENNSGAAAYASDGVTEINIAKGKGKLTLKKIWFTYLNNTKGELSPYEFNYNAQNTDENPNYSISQMDRWGNYKPDASNPLAIPNTYTGSNDENPYVEQDDKTLADKYMGVWNLKSIKLPSGALINVEYESDDYAYVQNKIATQMFKIIGTGSTSNTTIDLNAPLTEKNLRVYFKLEGGQTNISKYLESLDFVYFKTLVDLKKLPAPQNGYDRAKEYISGYSEVAGSGTVSINTGYVDLKKVEATKLGMEVNPIRKAAWDYLKNDKPNYLPGNNTITNAPSTIGWQTLNSIGGIFTSALSMITGYYRYCKIMGYAEEMIVNDTYYPSFIRLESPDKCKLGGGHRVKKITIDDNWNEVSNNAETSFQYGLEYSYKLPDGSSSGVAEYEPMVGGDENPLKKPYKYYNPNQTWTLANSFLFHEEPLGESYYPNANVGYSRVTVKSLIRGVSDLPASATQTKTRSGYSVNEFYTAKDFPVFVIPTSVTQKKYTPDINILFVGSLGFENRGYSQGYKIELNDMHGKPKASSSYGAFSDPAISTSIPIAKTEYIYNTVNPYSPSIPNKLSPFVTVLDGDAVSRLAAMGQTYDCFAEMNQHSNYSLEAGIGVNIDWTPPSLFIPSLWYNVNINQAITRMAVTNKVIYRSGILTKVRTTKDGGTSEAENLMFDKKTGAPLLTSVTNDFDKPVYSYSFAGHWSYSGMGDVSERYGHAYSFTSNTTPTSGTFTLSGAGAAAEFQEGDMVQVYNSSGSGSYQDFWVSTVNTSSNTISLIDESGANITMAAKNIKIVQPIQRNLLGVMSGSIVSLSHPVDNRTNSLIDGINGVSGYFTGADNYSFVSGICGLNGEKKIKLLLVAADGNISLHADRYNQQGTVNECSGTEIKFINYPANITGTSMMDLSVYTLVKKGNTIYFNANSGSGVPSFTGQFIDPHNCFPDCLEGVLHASSSTFHNDWEYNYGDADAPITSSVVATNPYRYGKTGIWRNEAAYAYQVERKQSTPSTDISKDGTYKNFVLFNWQTDDDKLYNDKWTYTGEVTRYSPYGFELENIDALGIYKAALYGYSNSVVTAVAANASYHEIAYDGFEEYGAGSIATTKKGGHLNLSYSGGSNISLSTLQSHTGSYAVSVAANQTITHSTSYVINNSNIGSKTNQYCTVNTDNLSDNKYTVSAWFYKTSGSGTPSISASVAGSTVTAVSTEVSPVIDGWQKVDYTFKFSGGTPTGFTVTFGLGSSAGYIDDIRIQPFKSGITTYVYDPKTLWLLAELDNRNYATFYNYDEEGTLVQVKKETEKGVTTVKTSRSNVSR